MYEEQFIQTNGIRLHVILTGPTDGRPLVLLHGFPEFWYSWRHQIEPLAAAGYRVIVPDQRGYNLSDKPDGVRHYHSDLLVQDILGLMDHLGYARFDLVGHDWGGVIAWQLATDYPERLHHLIILNAPHLIAYRRACLHHFPQLLSSWYVYVFQLPWLADRIFYVPIARWFLSTAKAGSFTAQDIARYQAAWAQPGVIKGSLDWYRSALPEIIKEILGGLVRLKNPWKLFTPPSIEMPVLILWGEQDAMLTSWLARENARYCSHGTLRFVPDATHWVQHDQPQVVTQAILDFLA